MRILPILAAAAVAALAVPAVAAPAAQSKVRTTTTEIHVSNGARHGHRVNWRKVCVTKWRHHHRVRTCHRVRRWG